MANDHRTVSWGTLGNYMGRAISDNLVFVQLTGVLEDDQLEGVLEDDELEGVLELEELGGVLDD